MSVFQRSYNAREGSEIITYDGFSIEFRPQSHRYWGMVGDKREPWTSVTSALSVIDRPALRKWYGKMDAEATLTLERAGQLAGVEVGDVIGVVRSLGVGAEAKKTAGADRGTAVHAALRIYCETGAVPALSDFPDEVKGYVQAACSWLVQARPAPVLIEQIVGSPKHGYAGRVDLIADFGGQCLCADFKTSPGARIYDEAHLQTAGYLEALPECGIEGVEGAVIVALGEDGEYREGICEAEASDFLSVLDTHRRMARIRSARQSKERAAKKAA